MTRKLIWGLFLTMLLLPSIKVARAANYDVKFMVESFEYTILNDECENSVALSGWGNYYDYYDMKIVIPEKVEYDGVQYTVKMITGDKDFSFDNISLIDIPASIKYIEPSFMSFEVDYKKSGINIICRCPATAFSNVKSINVNAPAIESVIYVPENEYEDYKTLIEKISSCTFYDTEDMFRDYCGIKVAKIGEEDVMPLGFIYDESSYKVLDEEKGTVALIKAENNSSCNKDGLYDQPEKVFYKNKEFTVTEVEYFAFHSINGAVKLPKTITKLASECFGQYVTKVDLSETKVKTIPTKLFLNYGDNDDSDPIVSEIILPKGCKKIESEAFYRCKELKKITIPKKVTKIGKKAFNKKCKTYYIKGDAIPSGLETLPMKKATIYVKASLFNKAKKALKKRISAGDCVVKKK